MGIPCLGWGTKLLPVPREVPAGCGRRHRLCWERPTACYGFSYLWEEAAVRTHFECCFGASVASRVFGLMSALNCNIYPMAHVLLCKTKQRIW